MDGIISCCMLPSIIQPRPIQSQLTTDSTGFSSSLGWPCWTTAGVSVELTVSCEREKAFAVFCERSNSCSSTSLGNGDGTVEPSKIFDCSTAMGFGRVWVAMVRADKVGPVTIVWIRTRDRFQTNNNCHVHNLLIVCSHVFRATRVGGRATVDPI